jgi:hypothetical protein
VGHTFAEPFGHRVLAVDQQYWDYRCSGLSGASGLILEGYDQIDMAVDKFFRCFLGGIFVG